MASFRKCVVIVLVIYLSRAGSTKMEILNLSKNCEDCKKLQGFCEKHIWCDINASIYFSKLPKEIKQRDIVPAHKTKSKLFKEDYMSISIHKTELANCGRSDRPANLQGIDFGTRSQVKNRVARNVSIMAENVVNMG